MTNEERIAYLLDKLAACEKDNAATIADLRKQVDGMKSTNDKVTKWWLEEQTKCRELHAKLAALEGGAK